MSLSDWKEYKIADLVEIIFSGGTPNTKVNEYWNGSLLWLSSGETKNRYINSTEKTITESGAQNSSTRLALSGDVVMASAGQGYTRGQVSFLNVNTFINQSVIAIRANEKLLDKKFLFYNLSNRYEELRAISDSNSIRGSITTKMVKSMTINIPNLDTQKSIANVLSSIDDKIENNKKINHHLEEMATSIFENMFPNVSSGKSTIGNYIIPKRGKNLLSKDAIVGKVPVVAGGLQPSTFHNIANTKSPVLTISASGANAGYVNLWHIPVWSSDSSYIDTSITDNVYFWYVMLKKRQQEIYDSQTGSAQPHIYPKHIEIMPTIDLSEDKMSHFTKQVTPLFESLGNNIKEIGKLQTLRNTLLPKLLSGEISVNQAAK
ncbi:restriction endonuclease subunit S [Streptococcus mutans]|uniref:restriction endonuclease subunit S n=3 Tax=Streptococcus mutans TaxID=1309 RepID=UPI0012E247E1|nr:restriction endonuclease subunit S [Streptococcus mutans]NLR01137.1 restriction endonuclease subunit S [Streptococcus mutans]QGU39551.1 restriction endonuclease subunit S [Streptococcus mutans]